MPWTLCPSGTFAGISAANRDTVLGDPPARYYLSGDGHRHPPFQWAVKPAVLQHFSDRMATGNLCLHVELHQEDVKAGSIPPQFAQVFQQNKVFGWELSIFKELLPVMTLIMDIMQELPKPSDGDVVTLDREINRMNGLAWKVGNPQWMRNAVAQSFPFRKYWTDLSRGKITRNGSTEDNYMQFINGYNNHAMSLRCDANNFIATNIMNNMAKHAGDTHLITVGDAHITINPVQNYLNIGTERGLIDPSNM